MSRAHEMLSEAPGRARLLRGVSANHLVLSLSRGRAEAKDEVVSKPLPILLSGCRPIRSSMQTAEFRSSARQRPGASAPDENAARARLQRARRDPVRARRRRRRGTRRRATPDQRRDLGKFQATAFARRDRGFARSRKFRPNRTRRENAGWGCSRRRSRFGRERRPVPSAALAVTREAEQRLAECGSLGRRQVLVYGACTFPVPDRGAWPETAGAGDHGY